LLAANNRLIRGERESLDELAATEEWTIRVAWGGLHLQGHGVVRGIAGDGAVQWMSLWGERLPD
jgi:hypothetical protein